MRKINEDRPPTGRHRIFDDDPFGLAFTDPDPAAHSVEAIRVLHQYGVDAWQAEMEVCRVLGRETYAAAVARSVVYTAAQHGEDPAVLLGRLSAEGRGEGDGRSWT